jgi:hypothetical protein
MNEQKNSVTISVTLTGLQAEALAHMAKRFTFEGARKLSGSHPEAYDMVEAVLQVQRALAHKGFAPH